MAVIRQACGATAALLALATGAAHAQETVRGIVLDARSGAPIAEARVAARGGVNSTVTDELGRFAIRVGTFPESLIVVRIGYAHAAAALGGPPTAAVVIRLVPAAVTLPEIAVASAAGTQDRVGAWQVPASTLQDTPAAIEPDVFRVLELVPAVSFSSPLSARPIIRGFDAPASAIRIDGFQVQNLYHLGRAFSAFPPAAAAAVRVEAGPHDPAVGGTLAGTVDVEGRIADSGAAHAGAALSFATASAWGSAGGRHLRLFGAARGVHFSAVNAATGRSIPYGFEISTVARCLAAVGRPEHDSRSSHPGII